MFPGRQDRDYIREKNIESRHLIAFESGLGPINVGIFPKFRQEFGQE
jgi:hypothetical protein